MPRPAQALLLLFPIFGSLLAGRFRSSETDLRSFAPPPRSRVARDSIALPNGSVIPLIAVPGPDGPPLFFLSETEISRTQWRALRPGGEGPGFAAPAGLAGAADYCRLLGERSGRTVRLPTRAEWRLAAAGGLSNAETPWGYDPLRVPRGVAFRRGSPPRRPGRAFGFGFRDMAGGLWEWSAEGLLLGGAWAENDPLHLRLDAALEPPPAYAGPDTGFRILVEARR